MKQEVDITFDNIYAENQTPYKMTNKLLDNSPKSSCAFLYNYLKSCCCFFLCL
jgi:hypothetical protein